MTLESDLARTLEEMAGEPPISISAQRVRAMSQQRQRRMRLAMGCFIAGATALAAVSLANAPSSAGRARLAPAPASHSARYTWLEVSFGVPHDWQLEDLNSPSFGGVSTGPYLSDQALRRSCQPTLVGGRQAVDCESVPVTSLLPNSTLAGWKAYASRPPIRLGTPQRIRGLLFYVRSGTVASLWCRNIGGQSEMVATVQGLDFWYVLDGCVAGPSVRGGLESVESILNSTQLTSVH